MEHTQPQLGAMNADLTATQPEYRAWLGELKSRFRDVQLKAAVAVNTTLLRFYWELVRQWYHFWNESAPIAKQAVSQLQSIPWGHNLAIIAKCGSTDEALYYVQKTQAHGWSRSVLVHQIESGLWEREGRAITNFAQTLPAAQSDLAAQMLKDPYVFDFLSLTKEHTERELETSLIEHITQFLLELGLDSSELKQAIA